MRAEAPDWARAYIGIPFRDKGRTREGCDCYGLLRLIFAEHYGVILPDRQDYPGTSKEDAEHCAALHRAELDRGDWTEVRAGEEQEGDVVVVRVVGHPWHYGIVVAPGVAIHTMLARQDSVLLRYRNPQYRHIIAQPRATKVEGSGFYRYRLMTLGGHLQRPS